MSERSETEIDRQEGFHTISPEQADSLRKQIPGEEKIDHLGNLFSILRDPTRLRILLYVSRQELCVHDLTELLDMNQPAVSHQLGKLQDHNLLERRKDGRVVYYSLKDEVSIQLINKALDLLP
ncbi:MAG: ArsR/SmtB family transcription factor [bacterium]